MSSTHNYIECECDSGEHVLRVTAESEQDEWGWPPLNVEVFLVHWRPWYKRVWVAIRYVFGYKSRFGHFDTICINREQAEKLVTVIRSVYPN